MTFFDKFWKIRPKFWRKKLSMIRDGTTDFFFWKMEFFDKEKFRVMPYLDQFSEIPLWKINPSSSQGHVWIKQTTRRPLLESAYHFITQCDPNHLVYQTPDDHKFQIKYKMYHKMTVFFIQLQVSCAEDIHGTGFKIDSIWYSTLIECGTEVW